MVKFSGVYILEVAVTVMGNKYSTILVVAKLTKSCAVNILLSCCLPCYLLENNTVMIPTPFD